MTPHRNLSAYSSHLYINPLVGPFHPLFFLHTYLDQGRRAHAFRTTGGDQLHCTSAGLVLSDGSSWAVSGAIFACLKVCLPLPSCFSFSLAFRRASVPGAEEDDMVFGLDVDLGLGWWDERGGLWAEASGERGCCVLFCV